MANNITKVIITDEYTAYIRPGIIPVPLCPGTIPVPLTYREYSVHGGSYKKEETDDDSEEVE